MILKNFSLILLVISSVSAFEEVRKVDKDFYRGGRVLDTIELSSISTPDIALEEILKKRGGEVVFTRQEFTINQLSHILKLGYGYSEDKRRTVESFDNAYPVLIYLVNRDGAFVYIPKKNALGKIVDDNIKRRLFSATKHKDKDGYISAANFLIAGSPKLAGVRRPREGRKFLFIEAGRIAQNMELAANSIGLGVKAEPDLEQRKIRSLLKMPSGFEPVMMLSLGKLKNSNFQISPETLKQDEPAKKQKTSEKEQPKKQENLRIAIIVPERGADRRIINGLKNIFQISDAKCYVAAPDNEFRNSDGIKMSPDILINNLSVRDYDTLVFLDGSITSRVYRNDELVMDIMYEADQLNKTVAAYGYAVGVLARSGVLSGGVKASGSIGVRGSVKKYGGRFITESAVVRSGNIVTARSLDTLARRDIQGPEGVSGFAAEILKASENKAK
ncbi:intracellular protease, PfpI family [Sedimentisphaera cyanobacteriorum]|uniref:Intracellular protease, PfpI family n=1 Tax=Sedimentisphaera cyanobacteriorum TaxID=1940790 RepID=A0A1Q2HNN8_9BACT|nr:DJ-1/PfpI family protein [Sedimentisphaera cyanobacteriorum]AQQ08846.1 intracellular protease, PfpI family [Sedimentisphaera cyanobacteriorum]